MTTKKRVVEADEYYGIDGKLFEIKRQLRQKGGYPYDLVNLEEILHKITLGDFSGLTEPGAMTGETAQAPPATVCRHLPWEGAQPASECGRNPALTLESIQHLVHVPFLKDGESWIDGEELVSRAHRLKANWSQLDAEFLLEHQELIPASWQGRWIPFAGTVWKARDGRRFIAYLDSFGDRWYLNFYWLDNRYDDDNRLPGLRKSA